MPTPSPLWRTHLRHFGELAYLAVSSMSRLRETEGTIPEKTKIQSLAKMILPRNRMALKFGKALSQRRIPFGRICGWGPDPGGTLRYSFVFHLLSSTSWKERLPNCHPPFSLPAACPLPPSLPPAAPCAPRSPSHAMTTSSTKFYKSSRPHLWLRIYES